MSSKKSEVSKDQPTFEKRSSSKMQKKSEIRAKYLKNIKSGGSSAPIPFLDSYGNCLASQSPYSRLEPPENLYYVGTSFSNDHLKSMMDLPSYNLRKPLATYGTKFTFKSGEAGRIANSEKLYELAKPISELGSVLHLEISVNDIDFNASPSDYESFAETLFTINSHLGVPVFISWGEGMNDPKKNSNISSDTYISSFRMISDKIKSKTNLTALMWQPTVSAIYDRTNKTNENFEPNPLAYWPGNSHVDWVAISAFSESLYDPYFKENFERFYNGFSARHYIDRPLPIAIISSSHTQKTLTNANSENSPSQNIKTNWSYLLSDQFLTNHRYLKLIMLPELDNEASDNVLSTALSSLDSGNRIALLGSRHEISFVCSGMVNCRTRRNSHTLDKISHFIATHFLRATLFLESLYSKTPVSTS